MTATISAPAIYTLTRYDATTYGIQQPNGSTAWFNYVTGSDRPAEHLAELNRPSDTCTLCNGTGTYRDRNGLTICHCGAGQANELSTCPVCGYELTYNDDYRTDDGEICDHCWRADR